MFMFTQIYEDYVYLGPFYKAKGAVVEDASLWGDEVCNHVGLVELMNKVEVLAKEFYENPRNNQEDVDQKQAEILQAWRAMKDYMWIHLANEEKVWPLIYKQFGKKVAQQVGELILKTDLKKKGKCFEVF